MNHVKACFGLFVTAFILFGCTTKSSDSRESSDSKKDSVQTKQTDSDLLSGNFALLVEPEENEQLMTWDPSALKGSRWPGEMVLFFSTDKEVFGSAFGFDMDTYRLIGKFSISKGETESSHKIILWGEKIVTIEGEGGEQRSQLGDRELKLLFKDAKAFLTSEFSMPEGGVKSAVTVQPLSPEEMAQVKADFTKAN